MISHRTEKHGVVLTRYAMAAPASLGLPFTSIGLHFPEALAAISGFRLPVTSSQHVNHFTEDAKKPEFCDHHQTIAN